MRRRWGLRPPRPNHRVPEDVRLGAAKQRTRFDAELLDKALPCLLIESEGVRLAAGPVERGHRQRPQLLQIGIRSALDQKLGKPSEPFVAGSQRAKPGAQRCGPQLGQPDHGRVIGQLRCADVTGPQLEGLSRIDGRRLRVGALQPERWMIPLPGQIPTRTRRSRDTSTRNSFGPASSRLGKTLVMRSVLFTGPGLARASNPSSTACRPRRGGRSSPPTLMGPRIRTEGFMA